MLTIQASGLDAPVCIYKGFVENFTEFLLNSRAHTRKLKNSSNPQKTQSNG